MTLSDFLINYGWNQDDANKVEDAYRTGGVAAAKATVVWMDDEDHDYSGEMADCIGRWEKECS